MKQKKKYGGYIKLKVENNKNSHYKQITGLNTKTFNNTQYTIICSHHCFHFADISDFRCSLVNLQMYEILRKACLGQYYVNQSMSPLERLVRFSSRYTHMSGEGGIFANAYLIETANGVVVIDSAHSQ
jgi:hypothetical protein